MCVSLANGRAHIVQWRLAAVRLQPLVAIVDGEKARVCVCVRARAVGAWQWGRAWTISVTMAIGKQKQKHQW